MLVRDRKQESYLETTMCNFSELRQQFVEGVEGNSALRTAVNVALDEVRAEVNIEKSGQEFFRQTTESDLQQMRQGITNVIMRSDTVLASAKEMIAADEEAHQ